MNKETNSQPSNVGHTPGELWRDDDGFIAQGTGENYKTFASTNVNDDDIDDREERAEQIIKSFNATYGKGINPEAVPQMYAALKWLWDIIGTARDGGKAWCSVREQPGAQEFFENMLKSMSKANNLK